MLPHADIHGRCYQDALVGGEKGRGGEVIRMAVRHFCHQVRRGGGNDQEIRRARELDVAHLHLVGQAEKRRVDFLARKAGERQRCYEFLRGSREDDPDTGAAGLQEADEFMRLVGGTAAADDEKYRLAGKGCHVAIMPAISPRCQPALR